MGASAGVALLVLLSMMAGACAAGPNSVRTERAGVGASGPDDARTLVISMRWEPKTLTRMTTSTQGVTPGAPYQFFHAGLAQLDERGIPQLQLAEAFPQLGTDTWKVFPDGRMETIWKLRPNLTWHDGAPLVSDDFVLARQFVRTVALPGRDQAEIEDVLAPDPRTVVIRYKVPYPDAGESPYEPLPRHILSPLLGPGLEQLEGRDAFEAFGLPYFTTEFVGLGPYRLEAWEPGSFITGIAFPDYLNGKPKIGRVQLAWIADVNVAVANLLSGTVHHATDRSLTFEQVSVLRREWAARGDPGAILLTSVATVYGQVQYRPDYARPAALLDLRFRQALAHSIDKQAIVEAVLDGEPGMADTLVSKEEVFYPELDRMLTKYPYDLRRADQLLAEMGFTKDRDGFYGQASTRATPEIMAPGDGGGYLKEALVLADGWKRAGLEAPIRTLSAAEQLDQELGSTFPTIRLTQAQLSASPFFYFNVVNTSSPATRWLGRNRGAYFDPDMERLYEVHTTSLDRNVRNQAVMQAMKLVSDQAAYLPLYYRYDVVAHTGSLVGPRGARQTDAMWNVEEWAWR